ncbi:MAG: alpha/beta hydrolase [Spirochaetota bacterium]|nr:alpha/beta hydrolase [Spirochaetota bacterium]
MISDYINIERDIKSEALQRITEYGLKSSFVNVNNYNIHYVSAGEGEPIILIHGWLCWGAYWNRIIPLLSKRYRVYALDLLGNGISDKPCNNFIKYTIDEQVEIVEKFIEQLSLNNVCIMGHSLGGATAAKVAMNSPEKIKKLVLIGAVGFRKGLKRLPLSLRGAWAMHIERMIPYFVSKGTIKFFHKRYLFYHENPVDDKLIDEMVLVNYSNNESRMACQKSGEGIFNDFVNSKAVNISIPTLLIWGKYDKLSPISVGKEYHDLIGNSKLEIIDNAAHMVFHEKPDEVARLILCFL